MIAALYVQVGGCYYGLDGVDPWPEARDARTYAGPWPVVAHPPCARWCRLAGLVEARYGIPRHQDGGCFASALAAVRRWGGVLEHPRATDAWPAHGLPRPSLGAWSRSLLRPREWVTEVYQARYGHRAPKPTWLLVVSDAHPPDLDWAEVRSTGVRTSWADAEAGRRRGVEVMGKRERSATPPAFRDLLLSIARSADGSA